MKRNNPTFNDIFQAMKDMKVLSLLIVLVVIGSIVAALLPPLVLERVVNLLTAGEEASFLLVAGYFLMLLLAALLESAREALLTVLGQKITHHLRSTLCDKLSRLPADTFVKTEPGVTASRFVGDVDTVEELFTSGIISMFADACQVVSIFVILFIKNTGLAIVMLVFMPFVYVFTRTVQKRTLKAQKENRVAIGRASGHVPETIKCIRTIHSMRAEKYMEDKYEQSLSDSFAAVEKTNFYDSIYSPTILILNAAITAGVMILAATGNIHIQNFFGMSVGTAVAVISYISQVFSPIESIGMELQTIQSAAAGVHRINEFLLQDERDMSAQMHAADLYGSTTDSYINSDGLQKENQDAIALSFDHVTFGYQADQTILKDVSLTVHKGEQVTITGRTGAGKSTMFKLLLGLYMPVSGSVIVNGQKAEDIPDARKRHIFGYVEQAFYQVPGTVADQIRLFDKTISDAQMKKAAHMVGLDETIRNLENGYDTPCSAGIFSQGQWQLLSIARAIAAEPEILLLDEITANLDADTEQMVLNALKSASENRTVLSISHRLYEHMGGREFVLS